MELLNTYAHIISSKTKQISERFHKLTDKQLFERPHNCNHYVWIVGHITFYRSQCLTLFDEGFKIEEEETSLFGPNSKIVNNNLYPAKEKLIEAFKSRGQMICDNLLKMTEDRLHKSYDFNYTGYSPTVKGVLNFLYMHELGHLGELNYLYNILKAD